jgi:hypothetical protein
MKLKILKKLKVQKDQPKKGKVPDMIPPQKKIRLVKINGHTVDRLKLERLELDPTELGTMMIAVRGSKLNKKAN